MRLSLLDKSNYLRGLLILIKADKKVTVEEERMMMRICKVLGFEETFCRDAIKNLLENEYIADDAPVFSDEEFARSFIVDGLRLSAADGDMCDFEISYLEKTAFANEIDMQWYNEIKEMQMEALNQEDKLNLVVADYL